MDKSFYDPTPIFHIWFLSQIPIFHKDIRTAIMQQYIQQKREEVRDADDNMLCRINISLAELLLIKIEYVRPIYLLNLCCLCACAPRGTLCYLNEEEYEMVQKLPLYFKAKFNVKPKLADKVPVLVSQDRHHREISLIS